MSNSKQESLERLAIATERIADSLQTLAILEYEKRMNELIAERYHLPRSQQVTQSPEVLGVRPRVSNRVDNDG